MYMKGYSLLKICTAIKVLLCVCVLKMLDSLSSSYLSAIEVCLLLMDHRRWGHPPMKSLRKLPIVSVLLCFRPWKRSKIFFTISFDNVHRLNWNDQFLCGGYGPLKNVAHVSSHSFHPKTHFNLRAKHVMKFSIRFKLELNTDRTSYKIMH